MTEAALFDYSSLGSGVVLDVHTSDPFERAGVTDSSSEALVDYDRKARLIEHISSMVHSAPSWDGDEAAVSAGSASTAIRFLRLLPSNRLLPLVAPEGEGGVLLVWEAPFGNCVAVAEPDTLHLVDQPGTRSVYHVDAQPFPVGGRIPVSILHRVPIR